MTVPSSHLRAGFSSASATALRCGDSRRFIRPATTPVATFRAAREAGFTLLELLVACVLGMLVMGLTISAYRHTQRTITRAEALLRLHRAAGDIGEQWELDANTLLQHVACNVTTTSAAGIKSLVQFTGMRAVVHGFDNQTYDLPRDTDLAWVRWSWQATDRRLTRAESPPPQWIQAFLGESSATMEGNAARPVLGMRPNPVRTYAEFETGWKEWHNPLAGDPSIMSRTRIYDKLFLTGTDVDGTTRTYGGLDAERTANALGQVPNGSIGSLPAAASLPVPDPRRTMAEDVTDCSITVIARNGSTHQSQAFDGQTQDGFGPQRGQRPALLRLSFTLTDRRTGLSQKFTFSGKAP